MKESIKMIKYSDELHKEEGEKAKQQDYDWKCLKLKKIFDFFSSIKTLDISFENTLMPKFTQ